MRDAVFAVDIGGTNTVVASVSKAGAVLSSLRYSTDRNNSETTVRQIAEALKSLGPPRPGQRLGVGAPNACFERGALESPPNLQWGEITPLASMLVQATGLETRLINDADAAAIGEGAFGAAMGLSHYIVVTLGTGVGSGIVCDGRLIRGARGRAAELGHLLVNRDGMPCRCGKRGCLETVASARALTLHVQRALVENSTPGPLTEYCPIDGNRALTGEDVFCAAEAGDVRAVAAFERVADFLGRALADAVTLFGPEKIILTGGLTRAGDRLLEPTRRTFEESLRLIDRGRVGLTISELPEGTPALLGAARLVLSDNIPWLASGAYRAGE